jgi:hypothetical protein
MPIKVVCQCGKNFQAKDEYEGRRAMCPSCRREFVFEVAGASISQEGTSDKTTPQAVRHRDDGYTELASIAHPEPSRPFWKDPIVVIGAALPTLILCVFFGYLYVDYRAKALHRRVYAVKLKADSLLASGDVRQAFDCCQQILAEAGPTESQDAVRGQSQNAPGQALSEGQSST